MPVYRQSPPVTYPSLSSGEFRADWLACRRPARPWPGACLPVAPRWAPAPRRGASPLHGGVSGQPPNEAMSRLSLNGRLQRSRSAEGVVWRSAAVRTKCRSVRMLSVLCSWVPGQAFGSEQRKLLALVFSDIVFFVKQNSDVSSV